MSNEDENLMEDHDYDGIQELDNDLPFWWIALFVITVIFGFSYMAYDMLGLGLNQDQRLEQSFKVAEEKQKAYEWSLVKESAKGNQTAAVEVVELPEPTEGNISRGKEIFVKNCFSCHGMEGQGLVGPNLTDNFFIHGPELADAVRIITYGNPAKGMIAWTATLNKDQIFDVACFVQSLKGKNLTGKPPEGKEYKE